MFAPVTFRRWRGRILYVLSSLIGMSSISSSECPIKRKVERGCFEAIGSTQSSLSLYSPARDPHSGLSMESLEAKDQVIKEYTPKIEV